MKSPVARFLILAQVATVAFSNPVHAQSALDTLSRQPGPVADLQYLQLTPDQVRARDKKLQSVYKLYSNGSLGSMAQQIESLFAVNVFDFRVGDKVYTPSLSNKKQVMDAAVRYYTGCMGCKPVIGDDAYFNAVTDSEKNEARYQSNQSQNNPVRFMSPLATVPESQIGRAMTIVLKARNVSVDFISGEVIDSSKIVNSVVSPFTLTSARYATHDDKTTYGIFGGVNYHHKEAVAMVSTAKRPIFESPAMVNFTQAMADLRLKALDATVVFTADGIYPYAEGYDAYRTDSRQTTVIYPQFSRVAPIPQPIIYISSSATQTQITSLLRSQAPMIYAYNKLFGQNLLPQVEELADSVSRYPLIAQDLAARGVDIRTEEGKKKAYNAYLQTVYMAEVAGAGLLGIAAVLASPIYAPLLIVNAAAVVVIL